MTALLLAALALAAPPADEKPADLFKDCRYAKPEDRPPEELRLTFTKFAESVKGGGQAKFCLNSVEVSDQEDPKRGEYGTGINIPWMRKNFSAEVMGCRKDSDDTYLIRTGTTYTFWVRTRSEGWKLYKYGDKPIQ